MGRNKIQTETVRLDKLVKRTELKRIMESYLVSKTDIQIQKEELYGLIIELVCVCGGGESFILLLLSATTYTRTCTHVYTHMAHTHTIVMNRRKYSSIIMTIIMIIFMYR